jgi:putative N6-adenine-specific DNA methylase
VAVIQKRNQVDAFAVTALGLETTCRRELAELGIRGRADEGGVGWRGSPESVSRANLWLRTASRVVVRVAEFRATAFYALELAARRVAWERFVGPTSKVRFRVTCRKSKLYHSAAVAQRLADAVSRCVPGVRVETPDSDVDEAVDRWTAGPVNRQSPANSDSMAQLFVVRLVHDVCTISADTSGALLHMRGYRQQIGKAPIRETIAAAMLLGAEWPGDVPLLDPMCGSGTIAIEAARMARRMAPGRERRFAFQDWPEHDADAWRALVEEARDNEAPRVPAPVVASDRDCGAIDAALANAQRAGVAADIELSVAPISALTAAGTKGWLITNPPYGVRVGEKGPLRNLYAQLGNVARARVPGWTIGFLSADRRLESQTRLELRERFATRNGGIAVRLMVGRVPESGPQTL